jgi:hypothetical protein
LLIQKNFVYFTLYADTGSRGLTLAGDPWSFPYDHYTVSLTMKIPFKEHIINNNPVYGMPVNTTWISAPWMYTISSDPENTFLKIYMGFIRNEFSTFYTVFPILLVFFLVGAISLLEPKDIDARIGISIGLFAFVFAYVTIVTDLKPQYIKTLNIVTLADMMLKVLLIATTAFTISSVIGYSVAKTMKENASQWIKSIHMRAYSLHLLSNISLIFSLFCKFISIKRLHLYLNSSVTACTSF